MSVSAYSSLPPTSPAQIDFGWIKEAWALFTARPGVWAGALLLGFLIEAVLWLLLAIPTGVLASLQSDFPIFRPHGQAVSVPISPYRDFAQTGVFSILLAGISEAIMGGLCRMALRQKRGELISIVDLFSALPQSLPLFMIGIILPAGLGLLEGLGLWLLHYSVSPDTAVTVVNAAFWLPEVILPGLLMFAPFLVLNTGATAPDAILGSMRLLRGQAWKGIWFYIVASFVGGLGILLCGVGILATYPVFILSIAVGYLALTQPAVTQTPSFEPAPVGVWPPPPRVPGE